MGIGFRAPPYQFQQFHEEGGIPALQAAQRLDVADLARRRGLVKQQGNGRLRPVAEAPGRFPQRLALTRRRGLRRAR